MPYLKRNSEGQIVAVLAAPEAGMTEQVAADHPELLLFLAGSQGGASNLELLSADLSMIRVIEDVIDLLIAKNVLMFSELPMAVQQKLLRKKGAREKLFGVGDILNNDDGLL